MSDESQNQFSSVLSAIPGYRGYRSKEDRRDADRRVREKVANSLNVLADRIQAIARSLADQRQIMAVGPVDEFAQSVRNLSIRISTATYGYGGLFSDRNVDDRALDQLRQFDESLLVDIEKIEANVEKVEQAHSSNLDLTGAAREGSNSVNQLRRRFETRSEVIETAQPAAPESVASVISPSEPAKEPEIFNLHERDALTISGSNYIVDGRIDLQSGSDSIRLFRIDGNQKLWLLAPATEAFMPALVNETAGSADAGAEQTAVKGTGSAIVEGRKAKERPISLSIQRNDDSVTLAIDWTGEVQRFEGKEIAFEDIEIYPAVGASER